MQMENEINLGVSVAMVIVSGFLELVPSAKEWFESKFTPRQKQIVMFLLPLLMAAAAIAVKCSVPELGQACPDGGINRLFDVLLATGYGWFSGQVTHHGTNFMVKEKEDE